MATDGGGGDGMPAWLAALTAALATIGTSAAAAYAWLRKVRVQSRRDKQRAYSETGRPYKDLFEELRDELAAARSVIEEIRKEHVECRVKLARLEERVAYLEAQGRGAQP